MKRFIITFSIGIIVFMLGNKLGEIDQREKDIAFVAENYASAQNRLKKNTEVLQKAYNDALRKQGETYKLYLNEITSHCNARLSMCQDHINKAVENTLKLKGLK